MMVPRQFSRRLPPPLRLSLSPPLLEQPCVTCGGLLPSEWYLVSSPHESPLFLSGIHCRRPLLQLPYHRTRNPSSRLLRSASCSRSNQPCVPAKCRLRQPAS